MIFEGKDFYCYILFYCLVFFTLQDIGQHVLLQLFVNDVVYQFLIKMKVFLDASRCYTSPNSQGTYLKILRIKRAF